MTVVTGEYQHALDNKGRIFIPAKLRDELGTAAYVTLSMDRCLSVYSEESWNGLVEKVNALPFVRQRKMRYAANWTHRDAFCFRRVCATGRAW